jgi:hypothetical protein
MLDDDTLYTEAVCNTCGSGKWLASQVFTPGRTVIVDNPEDVIALVEQGMGAIDGGQLESWMVEWYDDDANEPWEVKHEP